MKEENIFVAIGQYDDETAYKYTFEKDGKYFALLDAYDDLHIELDSSVSIELP